MFELQSHYYIHFRTNTFWKDETMDEQRQDDQLEPIYSSSVPIQDVALKTCRKQWTIEKGGEKGSGISVLMAQHHDDEYHCCFFKSLT